MGPPKQARGDLSFREYVELPIAIQQTWDSYIEVTSALTQLAQAGAYAQAALLVQSTFSDDRITAVMNTRINSIFGRPMQFAWRGQSDPADDSPDEVKELRAAVAHLIESKWEQIFPAASLRELTRWGIHLNLGLGELVWGWDGELMLPTLKVWNPQFAYWRWDTRSTWLIHTGGTLELHPGDGHWMVFAPFGLNHGWLYGLIHSLGYLWMDRLFTMRNWARAIEKFSLGVVKAYAPADGSNEDKTRFEGAIQNMPHEATVMLPITEKGNKFDLEMLKTDDMVGWESFRERIKQIDSSIAITVLGQNLSTEISGGSSGGSKAAAKVHNDIREDILKADAEILESTIKQQVLTPFVRANFAEVAAELGCDVDSLVPDVTWNIEPPEDKSQDAAAIGALSTAFAGFVLAGVPVDYAALCEQFDIPILAERSQPPRPPPADAPEPHMLPARGTPQLEMHALSRLPAGSVKGKSALADLAEALTRELKIATKTERDNLVRICETSSSYAEMRKRIRTLYHHWSPVELRHVFERAMVAASVIGRLSMHKDRTGRGLAQ